MSSSLLLRVLLVGVLGHYCDATSPQPFGQLTRSSLNTCPKLEPVVNSCGIASDSSLDNKTKAEMYPFFCTASCMANFDQAMPGLTENACTGSILMQLPASCASWNVESFGQSMFRSFELCPPWQSAAAQCGILANETASLTLTSVLKSTCSTSCLALLETLTLSSFGCSVVQIADIAPTCLSIGYDSFYYAKQQSAIAGPTLVVGASPVEVALPSSRIIQLNYQHTSGEFFSIVIDGPNPQEVYVTQPGNVPIRLTEAKGVGRVVFTAKFAVPQTTYKLMMFSVDAPTVAVSVYRGIDPLSQAPAPTFEFGVVLNGTLGMCGIDNIYRQCGVDVSQLPTTSDDIISAVICSDTCAPLLDRNSPAIVALLPCMQQLLPMFTLLGSINCDSNSAPPPLGSVGVNGTLKVESSSMITFAFADPFATYRGVELSGPAMELFSPTMQSLGSVAQGQKISLNAVSLEVPYFAKITTSSSASVAIATKPSVFALDWPKGNSKVLHPSYILHWRVYGAHLLLGLEVKTLGWAGFGLGEPSSGSMPGADIVTVGIDGDEAVAVDRFAVGKKYPQEDAQQDWMPWGFQQVDGQSHYVLRRLLDTGDNEFDRPVSEGPTRIIFAFSDTAATNSSTLSYHSDRRGSDSVEFIPASQASESAPSGSETVVDLIFNNYRVPAQRTTYSCSTFVFPEDKDYHAIKFSAVVSAASKRNVHHFVLYTCDTATQFFSDYFGRAAQCAPILGNPSSGCTSVMYAWASGQGDVAFPSDVGFRVGKTGVKGVALEIHYDNPAFAEDLRDSSGIRVTLTPQLRTHDVGVLGLGDFYVTQPQEIRAGESCRHFEYTCPSECTSSWSHDITVFGDFLHMHKIGTQMWTTVNRGSEVAGTLNRVDYWDGNYQRFTPIGSSGAFTAGKGFVVKRGDRLNTHCVYSNPTSKSVRFSVGSDDEMCMDFVYYYPNLGTATQAYTACTANYAGGRNCTTCGVGSNAGSCLQIKNPSQLDAVGPGTTRMFAGSADTRQCPPSPPTSSPTPTPTVATPAPWSRARVAASSAPSPPRSSLVVVSLAVLVVALVGLCGV